MEFYCLCFWWSHPNEISSVSHTLTWSSLFLSHCGGSSASIFISFKSRVQFVAVVANYRCERREIAQKIKSQLISLKSVNFVGMMSWTEGVARRRCANLFILSVARSTTKQNIKSTKIPHDNGLSIGRRICAPTMLWYSQSSKTIFVAVKWVKFNWVPTPIRC